jgi:hypothetical protein
LSWSKSVGFTGRNVQIHVEIDDGQNEKLQFEFIKLYTFTFQAMGSTLSSIASFPGVSLSLTGTIGQDIVAASHQIKLPKDQWPVQTRAKAGGPIARILCSDLQVSKNIKLGR